MKHLKRFNENSDTKLDELKAKIDKMTHEELAKLWRFGSSDNELFHGEAGKYFQDRLFNHFGGFNPSLSKGIGWKRNEAFSFLKRKSRNDDDDWPTYKVPQAIKDVLMKQGWFGIGYDEDYHVIANHPERGNGCLVPDKYIEELLKAEEENKK